MLYPFELRAHLEINYIVYKYLQTINILVTKVILSLICPIVYRVGYGHANRLNQQSALP